MTISKNIQYISIAALFAVAVFFALAPSVRAETSVESLLKQIQALNEQIKTLQEKLAGLHGDAQELRVELRAELKEGMTDEDIKKIQEILASDPDIYPRGLITGYYGPLTKEALKRFQQRFELKVTGELDEETREYLEDLLRERFNGKVPPGLLRAPGIAKKVELRIRERCDDRNGLGFLCQKLKIKYGDDDSDDDANDDDDNGELEIEVEFEDGDAKVKIVYENGKKQNFTFKDMTDEGDIIDEIVEKTDLTKDEVEDAIEFEENQGDVEEIRVEIDGDEAKVTVEYENGDTDLFIYDTTNHAEIITAVADEVDMDEDDVEDIIEFEDDSDEIESIKVEFDGDDSEVTVKYENNTTESFDLDNVTRHNDVIEAIAEEIDVDEDEVRDIIEFLDGDLTIEVRVEDGEAEVDITYENGDSESFTLDMDDEDEIVAEIADRTDLTEEEVEDALEITFKD